MDPDLPEVEIPEYINEQVTAANEWCVSVATQTEEDGVTEITITDTDIPVNDLSLVFEGSINTPNRKVSVVSSDATTILTGNVISEKTHLQVWVDDLSFPARITIRLAS
jgi:hypothetical protein